VTDANFVELPDPVPGATPAELLRAIETAFERLQASRPPGRSKLGIQADPRLTAAVEAARDAGIEWGKIADALDIRRGNAYQRYRRRPRPKSGKKR
jgi:hypothetical protein